MAKVYEGFRIDEDTAKKLAYIAWFDRKNKTAIVTELLNNHIKKWERDNGAITEALIKQSEK